MKRNRTLTPSKSLDFLGNKEKSVKQIYAIKSMALTEYINNFVEDKDFKQSEVAEKLDMFESQLSRWLSGVHNMTLQSIMKLESACSIEILNPAIWDGTSLAKPKRVFERVFSEKAAEVESEIHLDKNQAKVFTMPLTTYTHNTASNAR